MKNRIRFLLIAYLIVLSPVLKGQSQVAWNCSAKRINDTAYDLHMKATIQKGWHLYSQHQPSDAIAIPTKIKFSHNPLIMFTGNIMEIGNLVKYEDTLLDISAFEYEEKVDFVQRISLRSNVKTNTSLMIVYQVCTNQKCLPAQTKSFNIKVP